MKRACLILDINHIAIVRATNVIPFEGVLKTISNTPYLCKKAGSPFSDMISDLIREEGIVPPIDYKKIFEDGYYEEMVHLSYKILEDYLPYSSDYNSMVLFSLNGVCPDDNEHGFANNVFSSKNCYVIEPLKYHIKDVVSLMPTDTSIKGDVILSEEAIVGIRKNVFMALKEEEKDILRNLPFTVKLFEGSLSDAVYQDLKNSGKYMPETLSLSREHGGYLPSSTSEEQKRVIGDIARQYGKAQVLFFHILNHKNDEMEKLENVKDELDNSLVVQDYYLLRFLEDFLLYFQAPEDLRRNVSSSFSHAYFYKKLGAFIKQIGISQYRRFVLHYNSKLLHEQKNGTLLTPEEIVCESRKSLENDSTLKY